MNSDKEKLENALLGRNKTGTSEVHMITFQIAPGAICKPKK